MRKEVIIAVVLGFLLGLVLTFGFWTANQAIKERKTEKTNKIITATPTPSPQVSFSINQPQNNLVTSNSKIEVAGQASPDSVIIAFSEDNQTFCVSDPDGFYSLSFPLVKGSNKITVKSINKLDEVEEKNLMVVYSTEL